MPEHYQLRLGNGSQLVVDHDDLIAWLLDDGAMVQPPGSSTWRPLAEFLAEADASRLAKPAKLADLPAIPLKPLEEPEQKPVPPPERWLEQRAPLFEEITKSDSRASGLLARAARLYESAGDWMFRRFKRKPAPPAVVSFEAPVPVVPPEAPPPAAAPPRPEPPTPPPLPVVDIPPPPVRTEPPVPVVASPRKPERTGPPTPFDELPILRFRDSDDVRIERPAPERKGPPPTTQDLPALQFADSDEPEDRFEEDVYQGERWSTIAWLWLKRIVLIGGLAAGAVVAVRTWATWWPRAQVAGVTVFSEVDKRAQQSTVNKLRTQALEKAVEQMPHVSSDTILLVMSTSVSGTLEPPEIFRRAYEAEERGMLALTSDEAQELRALRRQILLALSANDRETALDYDRVRTHRVPFPFEDSRVLEAFARGTRTLPPESRERLQALTGKAVAAGLETVTASER